ncbi:peptidyl-prolyl cis-trans isomerase [Arthroderma uncinatum]|uniref:peptidyl-prolyl cis-trans isomerase n=1 Tax=Arthroderma uncinatum TaxID=74035 RepID=UPI00144ACE9A|nr:peptidyl-prolyl cis-trans isomerase [Arthroderma uncinatum]KAF3490842.1 peptidyl-prolyl cis-trans isomerase [Arthroderma uncinatum]
MSVTLHTTHGDLKVEIFCEAVPKTAENFLALCASGAYNDTPFHRLMPSFMIQGGDISLSAANKNPSSSSPLPFDIPKGGTSIYHPALLEQEIHLPTLRHNARGILSMAGKPVKNQGGVGGAGQQDINGSQFFVTFAAAPHLDGKSTVFGKVLDPGTTGEKGEQVDTLTRLEKAHVKIDKKGRVVQPDAKKEKDNEEGESWEKIGIERVTIHANPFAG